MQVQGLERGRGLLQMQAWERGLGLERGLRVVGLEGLEQRRPVATQPGLGARRAGQWALRVLAKSPNSPSSGG